MLKRSPQSSTDDPPGLPGWTWREPLRLALLLILLGGAAIGAEAAAASSRSPEELAGMAQEALEEAGCQTVLPDPEQLKTLEAPRSLGISASVLLYLLLVLVLAFFLVWLVREFGVDLGDAPEEASELGQGGIRAGSSTFDPEELAALGKFDEAAHVLLLRAIGRLIESMPAPPSRARTSRELARLLPLSKERREAYLELVTRVEHSLFGGRATGAEGYARCRSCFHALVAE